MAVLTGSSGGLLIGGTTAGCVRSWNLTISRDPLETSCLGEEDRKYRTGMRGATGSADILYDPGGPAGAVFNTVFNDNAAPVNVSFVLSTADLKQITGDAIITSVSASVSVGEVQAVNVSFQFTGAIAGGW